MSRRSGTTLLRPYYSRMPWNIIFFMLFVGVWFSGTHAISSGNMPDFLLDADSAHENPKPFVVVVWLAWTLISIVGMRKIQDPKARRLPHAQFMVPAARSLVSDYEMRRKPVILDRYDKAGEMGFLGGPGAKEFDIERFSILKVKERAEERVREIEKFQSVRSSGKLRIIYYGIESSIDRVELLGIRVDRYLRGKGTDPEEVAPSIPVSD